MKSFFRKPIEILYEDQAFVVVNKPSGVLTTPTTKEKEKTLVAIVNYQIANDHSWNLHPCHRLDQETSGAIIFAKGKKNQQLMMDVFKDKKVKKIYTAFVQGPLKTAQGQFTASIDGKISTSKYKTIEQRDAFSVMEIEPVTGRRNQIRIHCAKHKHPIVGDRKFAFARDYALKFKRTALHASILEFHHPVTKAQIKVTCSLAQDMVNFLDKH